MLQTRLCTLHPLHSVAIVPDMWTIIKLSAWLLQSLYHQASLLAPGPPVLGTAKCSCLSGQAFFTRYFEALEALNFELAQSGMHQIVLSSYVDNEPSNLRASSFCIGYFEAPGALTFGLGRVAGTLQPFNPQPVTLVFCNMDNLPLMKGSTHFSCLI